MRIGRLLACTLALVSAGATGASAQDGGKVGITMGYPAAVGIIWHLGDTIAIRPELTFSGSSSETDRAGSTVDSEADGWAIGTGISALFYVKKYDRVRTYFSPRFTYEKIKSTVSSSSGVFDASSTGRASSYGIVGSFGAEGRIADKFSAFGEIGFGYEHTTTSSSSSPTRTKGDTWGTRAGVGVIFYF